LICALGASRLNEKTGRLCRLCCWQHEWDDSRRHRWPQGQRGGQAGPDRPPIVSMIFCVDIRTSVTEHLAHACRKCGFDSFSSFAKVMYLVAGKIKSGILPRLLAESIVALCRWLRERAWGGMGASAQRRCAGSLTDSGADPVEPDENKHPVTGKGGKVEMR